MIRRIAFFTVGFAHNRQVRMRFYEKIFPKDIEIYLVTTNKYKKKKGEEYSLGRTKIVTLDYNAATLPFALRRFCKENAIDRLMNIGFHTSAPLLLFATLGTKTDYCLNVLVDIFNQHTLVETKREALRDFLTIPLLAPFVWMARKVFFTDYLNYFRAPLFYLSPRSKMAHLAAPVNTDLYTIQDKTLARKRLGLPSKERIVLYVGRVNYLRGADVLMYLIKKNPEIRFVVIGHSEDEAFSRFNAKNLLHFERKNSEELLDYYNAADFSFCLNRGGGGIGMITGESLSAGTPAMISKQFKAHTSPALYQISVNNNAAQKTLEAFFALPENVRKDLRQKGRQYALDFYSGKAWAHSYLKEYLEN